VTITTTIKPFDGQNYLTSSKNQITNSIDKCYQIVGRFCKVPKW